jgi:hypothetical protein
MQQIDKLAYIQAGDYLEYRGRLAREYRGPVELSPGQDGKTIILVPGIVVDKVAVEQHRILAVLRDGKEIIRFEDNPSSKS